MRSAILRREVDSPLLRYSSDVTSQFGEDGIIAHILSVIEPANRYCIEFGAWDGRLYSNCYRLLVEEDWDGLMIEASAAKYAQLTQTYADYPRVSTLNALVQFDGPDALDNILERAGAPKNPGVLSIDIDGNDYYIFESLSKYEPELIVIEFNPTIPNDVFFIQEKSFDVNHGCSLLALIELGKRKGYELAVCTLCNAFFVKKEMLARIGVADNAISALYTPVQDGRIFQGYDNTIHVIGMDRLNWRPDVSLCFEDFQVLPRAMRVWKDAQK